MARCYSTWCDKFGKCSAECFKQVEEAFVAPVFNLEQIYTSGSTSVDYLLVDGYVLEVGFLLELLEALEDSPPGTGAVKINSLKFTKALTSLGIISHNVRGSYNYSNWKLFQEFKEQVKLALKGD